MTSSSHPSHKAPNLIPERGPLLCPQCQETMKMHRRKISKWYRLLICPSGCLDFEGHRQTALIDRGKVNYKCPMDKFEACALAGKLKCKECGE